MSGNRVKQKQMVARETILDIAEQLIRDGESGSFTLRDLATAAGVSLSTPFQYFGSKAGIRANLAYRMLRDISDIYCASSISDDAIDNVFLMANVGANYLLSDPKYYRCICKSIEEDGFSERNTLVRPKAEQLWRLALSAGNLSRPDTDALSKTYLPQLLAVIFRGILIMWVNGELSDSELRNAIESSLAGTLLGFVDDERRDKLIARMSVF